MSSVRPRFRLSRSSLLTVPAKSALSAFIVLVSLFGLQAADVNDVQPPAMSESAQQSSESMVAAAAADPLDSPYPIPWQWIVEVQTQASDLTTPQVRYFRSQALVSPDGQYAAYSRIQVELAPDATQHRVDSMLFLENLQTGDLQFVTASSPHVRNPYIQMGEYEQPGMIAILVPAAWSASGDRLLVRGFESRFGTDLASDFAVVWNRETNTMRAIAPSNITYSNAVMLGWSQANSEQILFRAGELGDESWPMLAVDFNGRAIATANDQPVVYGQLTNTFWNGPQARIELGQTPTTP